jgi:hypothetical protein
MAFIQHNAPRNDSRRLFTKKARIFGGGFQPSHGKVHRKDLQIKHNTTQHMTAHAAYRIWFNDFLTTEYFAEYHNLTLEKARELIRKGREIEEQIQQLQQTQEKHPTK